MKLNAYKLRRDAICDGGSLKWINKGEFDDLIETEKKKITFEVLQRHELERMKCFAFKVCDELTSRMDGAPMLNGCIKFQTSLSKSELFFLTKSI